MTSDRSPNEAWRDPIVAEVRQAREALFAEANYDIHEFCRRLSIRQATSGHSLRRRSSPSGETPKEEAGQPGPASKTG